MMLGCFLMVLVVGYVTACDSQADCPDTHCCAKRAFVEGEYNCVPYRRKYEICLPGGLDEIMFDGRYDINCPCQPGLMCQQFDISDGRGGFNPTGNPTCRNVTEDREFIRRQRQNWRNSMASADAYANGQNAYANGENGYANGQNAYANEQNGYANGQNAYANSVSERKRK